MLDCFNHPGIPPFILLLSQVGAEGLDMQKACKTVIHHDLHWNPTVLEQREGRVYRDNVKAKDVHVEALHYVLGYDYTIQKYAKHREAYKDFLLGETRFGEFLEAIVDEQGVESIDRNLYKPKQKGHWHIDLKPPALMPA